ncbi:MAG: LemA family protein [Crocinitomicaceae bacterium]
MIPLLILGTLIAIILVATWLVYNGFISAQNIVEEAFSGIDVHLKKRFELIPNLIEAVKGYNKHEAETLQRIVEERVKDSSLSDVAATDANITSHLRQIRILVEDYPELKANDQFKELMNNLSKVEDELALARRYYNGTVRELNIKVGSFPSSVVASVFGFKEMSFYKINDGEEVVPTIDLNK